MKKIFNKIFKKSKIFFLAIIYLIISFNVNRLNANECFDNFNINFIKTVDNQNPCPGETVTFILSATNKLGPTFPTITITDILPIELNFINAIATNGTVNFNNNTLTWTINNFALNDNAMLTITTTVKNSIKIGTNIKNQAKLEFTLVPPHSNPGTFSCNSNLINLIVNCNSSYIDRAIINKYC